MRAVVLGLRCGELVVCPLLPQAASVSAKTTAEYETSLRHEVREADVASPVMWASGANYVALRSREAGS